MADKSRYEPITSAPVLTAEEMARRNYQRAQAKAAREAEEAKRRQDLIKQGQREASRREETEQKYKGQKSHPRTRRPETVKIDDVETPIDEALADVKPQMAFEDRLRASPLWERALRRDRMEELVADGMDEAAADEQSRKEQEGRAAAFDQGREGVRKEGTNTGKEVRGFFESAVGGAIPLARAIGLRQMADEAEAHSAGAQAELSQTRDERYAHPRIAGAVAGAAQNIAQMAPGIAGSMLAGPAVGMGVMAGQFGSQEYSRAAYEGAEAGLAGNELTLYAGIQGGVEAAVMPIFSKIPGMAGIEGRVMRQAIARGVATHPKVLQSVVRGAGKLTKDVGAEVVEEVTTEVLHGIASERLLDEDVDYKAVLEDTVLQTIIMMGITEGVQQGGRLATSGQQIDAGQLAPQEVPAEAPEQPVPPITPEEEAFLQQPSRRKYDAAVKAGMPPVADGASTEGRAKYAEDRRKRIQTPDPAALEAPVQSQEPMAPAAGPMETPSGVVPDSAMDVFSQLMLEQGDPNEQEGQLQQQEQQIDQGQQGDQEGLLSQPAGTQDVGAPPASTMDSSQPAAHTRESFEKEYRDTFAEWQKNTPDQQVHKDKLAQLYDAYPDWVDEVDSTLPSADPDIEPIPDELRTQLAKDKDLKKAADEIGVKLSGDREADLRAIAENQRVYSTIPDVIREVTDGVDPEEVFENGDQYVEEIGSRLKTSKFPIPPQRISEAVEHFLSEQRVTTSPVAASGDLSPDQSAPSLADPVSKPEATSYHSGLSRSPAEVDEAIAEKSPVGVSAFAPLSGPMRKKLVEYADADGKVFIDSGAFTAFTKKKPLEWDKVLFTYREMVSSVKPEKRANVTIVAPDVVGDHDATIEIQRELSEKFQPFFESGATIIFPVQQGGHGKIWSNWADLTDTFRAEDNEKVIVGIPFNAAAWGQEDVLRFMRTRDRDQKMFGGDIRRFHLLGAGPAKVAKLFEAAEAEGLSTEGVSADAMPKKISQRKKPPKRTDVTDGRSLRSIVIAKGGISAKQLRKDYNQKDLKGNGLLNVMRIKGIPLDQMAQELESTGDLRTPENRNPADWLMEQLLANADGAKAQYTDAEISAQLEAEREAYERIKAIKDPRIDEAGIDQLREFGEEAGVLAADEGEPDEDFSEQDATEIIDISFDFGANVTRVGDLIERNGKRGVITRVQPGGAMIAAMEETTASGRKVGPRYSGFALIRKGDQYTKLGEATFPVTLSKFYSRFGDKTAEEITADFTSLWESLDADDKSRFAHRLRKFGIAGAKSSSKTEKIAESVANIITQSKDVPGKIREVYDIASEYPNLQGSFDDPETSKLFNEMMRRIDRVGLDLPPMIRASMIIPESRREMLHHLAKQQFGEDIADAMFDDLEEAAVDAEDGFTLKRPDKPKPKPTDFGTNENTKQGGLFDAGKPGELEGQQLLFNSDPGDLSNPKTQENKAPAAETVSPSQEDLMEQILREELGEKPEKPKTERKPRTPKTESTSVLSKEDIEQLRVDVDNNSPGFIRQLIQEKIVRFTGMSQERGLTQRERDGIERTIQRQQALLAELERIEDKRKAPQKPRSGGGKRKSKDTKKALDDALEDFGKSFDATAPMGLSPEQMRAAARLVRAALDHGVTSFEEFVNFVVKKFDENVAMRAAEGIELAWRTLKRLPEYSGVGEAGKVADVLKAASRGWNAVPGHFAQQLLSGKEYKAITEARKEAGEIVGQPIKAGTADAKTLDEAIEHGIVQAGRTIVEQGGTPVETFDKLVDLYARQPVLGVRDTTSMEMQAYSTPVPLAYLASHLGHVDDVTTVYEPTAGNGMLLIGTEIENAYPNELDPDRAKILRDQGFDVTTEDATTKTPPNVQVVLANPPFGKVKDENRKTIEFNIDGFRTTEVDHAIALQAMKGMEQDGYTVLILAAKGHNAKTELERRQAYSKGKDRPFYDALYSGYDVTNHFTVDGSLYSRQGASFPVDVIVLRPQGTVPVDKKRSTPWAIVPRIFNSWGEIRNAFFSDMATTSDGTGVRTGAGIDGSTDLPSGNPDDVGRVPRQNENAAAVDEGDIRTSESEPVVSAPVDGKSGGRRSGKKSGGSRSQSGLSGTPEGERSGAVNVPDADSTTGTGTGIDSGTRPDRMAGTGIAESGEVDPESHQSAYEPSSKNKTVETLIPTNLQNATRRALERVEDEHGSVDEFVRKELGYEKNDPYLLDMSAEQVDAIALAIYSDQHGSGMIVGDMTGVGKGRVAAAMMRYADRRGLVPLFVTEKPNLFGDIFRDLGDIGSNTPDAPFIALTTNDTSASANAIDLPDGRKLQSSKEVNLALFNEALTNLADGKGFVAVMDGKPTKINALFTMYSQMQTVKGNETPRRELIRRLMPNSYLIMDESHNAGGTKKERVNEDAPPDRAAFAREIVQTASGVMYLSATFAKRPDVMDLYSRTDMAKAVDGDISQLAEVVQQGGLPLQQVLSAMLGESGQYIRREKSFEGIEFATVDVDVNLEEQDRITEIFRRIRSLDVVVNEVVSGMAEALVASGQSAVAGDVSTGDAGLTSTSFSSILWNAVDQMLFALKADKTADEAIESWKNGEVPIIAVDNTMESILDEYVEAKNLSIGDVVNLSFRDVLHRYLERSRWITVDTGMRTERNKKITIKERLTDEQLDVDTEFGNALEMFNEAYAAIEATQIDAPASPIDWIRYRMQKAGMKIAEVTGRKSMLVYDDNNVAKLAARPRAEAGTRGKQETIRKINDGSLDGVILNRSGATGLSIHASAKVKNQKVRRMLIAQAAKNIDEFMQMLGRINRTGQVVKPRYGLLKSNSPAELRPAAVLSKKLSSLNASVTAKSKGAVGFEVTDVMNEVGGAIVQQYLHDNPEFAIALDMWRGEEESENSNEEASEAEALEDVVRKATGRSAILPIAQQREFWEDITELYNARIEELNALNANPLIAKTMDLDAKTLSTINLFAGSPDGGPFAAPADLEHIDIKSPGKPMTPDQIVGRIKEFYGIEDIDDRHGAEIKWARETRQKLTEEVEPYRAQLLSRVVTDEARAGRTAMLDTQLGFVMDAIERYAPGTVIQYTVDGMIFDGVVMSFSRKGKSGNPVAPSRWFMDVAINDPAKKLSIPVSRTRSMMKYGSSLDSVLRTFEHMQTTSRQRRWMGTGNLVAAYAQLATENGKLVFYTDDQGETKRGILMPRNFIASRFLESKPVQFSSPNDILRFFENGGSRLITADGVLVMVMRDRALSLVAPRARSRGAKYTLNRSITNAAQKEFVTAGSQMTLSVSGSQRQLDTLTAVLNVSPVEARLESDRDVARYTLGLTKTGEKVEPDPAPPEPTDQAREELREIQERRDGHLKDIQKEIRRFGRGENQGMFGLTAEMAKAISGYVFESFRAGAKSFEIVVRDLLKHMDAQEVAALKPTLIRTWNAFRRQYPQLDEATPEAFDAAMTSVTDKVIDEAIAEVTGEPVDRESADTEREPSIAERETAGGADRLYSTKNAVTDQTRERLGMEPRVRLPEQSREDQIAMVAVIGKTDAGRIETDKLIDELKTTPRATSVRENDLLNFRYAELDQKYESALTQKVAARAAGNDAEVAVQSTIAANTLKQLVELVELLSTTVSYALGSGLQARKALIDTSFTMARSLLEYEAAYGRKLDPEDSKDAAIIEGMQKQIDDLNAAKAELQSRLDAAEARANDLQIQLDEAHKEAMVVATAPAPPEKKSFLERLAEEGDNQIASAFAKIRSMKGKLYSIETATAELTEALIELASGYSKKGVVKLADFLSRVRKQLGPDTDKLLPQLTSAFNTVHEKAINDEQENITRNIDILDPESIGRAARNLHSFVIRRDGLDGSADGRDAAVDAVHEILVDIVPELSREETARAMSGIGIYSQLSQDEVEVVRRDQKAQLLLLEQISDWKKGQAPPATGQERPPVSDEQRELRKAVNEAKKAAGIVEATPGQLRSALDAAKRMARNRIADLTKSIETGERISVSRRVLTPDAELTTLREERDALQKLYDDAFGKNELSDEQRVSRAEKALDRAISNMESDLKSGKLYKDDPKAPVSSPAIEAKRAQLEALKASRDEMRLQSGEAQARSDAAYERLLRERDANLAQRIADKDFAPPAKKQDRELTPEMLKLRLAIEEKKQAILNERKKWEFENRHLVHKALVLGPLMGTAILRKGLTTIDQSLIGRQGGLLGITHPKLYAKAIKKAFASNWIEAKSIFPTKQDLFNTQAELDADARWVRLEKIAKLAITDVHGGFNREEGNQFVPEWVNELPGVGGAERAGSAFINTQRRLVFRSLVDKLSKTMDGKNKTISNADLRVIGNLVNVASGRVNVASWSGAIKAASALFFSPNWWASRLLWWAGQPIWQESRWLPDWMGGGEGASTEVRKLAAMEWGKQAAAQMAIIGLVSAGLLATFGDPGEDEEWEFYWSPDSPNFGKLRLGKTMFDMTFGLGQHMSFLARVLSGNQSDRWESREVDKWRLAQQYLRGKLAPVPSGVADYLVGESIGGQEFGTLEWAANKAAPLIFQDVWEAFKKEDPAYATAISAAMFFGIGARTYDERIKARKDVVNEVRSAKKQGKPQAEIDALLTEHLKEAAAIEAKEALRVAKPEDVARLEKIAASVASPELDEAIQKERGDVTLMASEMLSTEDKKKEKSPASDVAITTARSVLKAIAPTFEDADRLYTEGYRRRNGSITEKVGKRYVVKKNVIAARRRLRALYSD